MIRQSEINSLVAMPLLRMQPGDSVLGSLSVPPGWLRDQRSLGSLVMPVYHAVDCEVSAGLGHSCPDSSSNVPACRKAPNEYGGRIEKRFDQSRLLWPQPLAIPPFPVLVPVPSAQQARRGRARSAAFSALPPRVCPGSSSVQRYSGCVVSPVRSLICASFSSNRTRPRPFRSR